MFNDSLIDLLPLAKDTPYNEWIGEAKTRKALAVATERVSALTDKFQRDAENAKNILSMIRFNEYLAETNNEYNDEVNESEELVLVKPIVAPQPFTVFDDFDAESKMVKPALSPARSLRRTAICNTLKDQFNTISPICKRPTSFITGSISDSVNESEIDELMADVTTRMSMMNVSCDDETVIESSYCSVDDTSMMDDSVAELAFGIPSIN